MFLSPFFVFGFVFQQYANKILKLNYIELRGGDGADGKLNKFLVPFAIRALISLSQYQSFAREICNTIFFGSYSLICFAI